MEQAVKESLPQIVPGKVVRGGGISGWNNFVKPYAEESRFWSSLWISAGKLMSGELFTLMKSKKNQYKYAVRRIKRCTDI